MCYAAMARADLAECLREYDAFLDAGMFERLFWERVNRPTAGIRFPLAVDRYFLEPRNDAERKVTEAINAYRKIKAPEWEAEVFKQRKRYADAERALKAKPTKKAEADLGISSRKVEQLKGWLDGLKSMDNKPDDVAVHAMNYGPVIVQTEKGRMLTAMRYHCRLAGKPVSIDRQLPGLYNAFGAFLTVSSPQTAPIQGRIGANFFRPFWCAHPCAAQSALRPAKVGPLTDRSQPRSGHSPAADAWWSVNRSR